MMERLRLPPHVREKLRLQQVAGVLFSFASGIILSVLANALSTEEYFFLMPGIAALALLAGAVVLWRYWRQAPIPAVEMKTPYALYRPEDARRYARRGYIGFVPLYNGPRFVTEGLKGESAREAVRRLNEAIDDREYSKVPIVGTNLQPTVAAIESHRSRLEHCWLLTTERRRGEGSSRYAAFLADYLREVEGIHCQYYYGADYCIRTDNDALVTQIAYEQVRQAFSEARALGIKPEDVIVDITTGTRAMELGMILASLHRDYDVQFVSTRYGEQGEPQSDWLVPMIINFEPRYVEG